MTEVTPGRVGSRGSNCFAPDKGDRSSPVCYGAVVEPPAALSVPELSGPDPFTGRPIIYLPRPDGSAVLALDDAVGLLEQIVTPRTARSLSPITLPAP